MPLEKLSGVYTLKYAFDDSDLMRRLERAIQGFIVFSALLGALFLWEAEGLLPAMVFDIILVGWVLFVVDGFLTFVRPVASYYLGMALAVLGLATSLPQPEHYTFFQDGQVAAASIFTLGSAAEFAIVVLVAYYVFTSRRRATRPTSPAVQ